MKKLLTFILAFAMMCCPLIQCYAEENEEQADPGTQVSQEQEICIRVGLPKAPPAFPVLHMLEEKMLGENVGLELEVWDAPEQLIAMVQDGNHEMFAFPLTVISKLYNKGLDVQLMNVNTWGVTYFLTTDPNFQSWADLKGKKVYVPLQSSPPDALTQYFLKEAGLKVGEDVELVYAATTEVASLLASGEAEYATLIEPQVTAALEKNDQVIRSLSFEEEWQRVTETDTMIPNAGFGVTGSFAEENPELTAAFQNAYEESTEWVLEHPQETAALAEKYFGMDGGLVEKAIPNMGLCFKSAEDASSELDIFYQLLNDFDPSMIGGKLPDEGMYYEG
ncbi:MAG: ABC transporter substrate-binding protein [Eubacteriales bacterium]|nr:ABC transporter substrate-binding protein [Eubacteriales bacterium]